MGRIPTVKVQNPDVPDDFMVINQSDFDESKHTLFEGEDAPAEAADTSGDQVAGSIEPKGEAAGDSEAQEGGEADTGGGDAPATSEGFPEGYRYEPKKGGYGFLYGPSGAAIPGPSNGKWQGEDAAQQAARHHAEAHGGE